MLKDAIHTINSRDHILFDLLQQFGITNQGLYNEIISSFKRTKEVLKKKNVNYSSLKNALVPNGNKNEICLFFDAHKTTNPTFYGIDIMNKFLPLLKSVNTCSVFHGDYIFWNKHGEENIRELEQKITYINYTNLKKTRVFCIYVNNVPGSFIEKINKSLSNYSAYIGYSNVTCTSKFKWVLSFMLGSFIKHNKYIIMGHEDDRSNDEDVNMSIYPFEENGFTNISIQDILFNIFLSYKIERPVFPGFELDEKISLLALCGISGSLEQYNVQINEDKFNYLKKVKIINLKNAGIDILTTNELSNLIKDNLRKNYIFNFKHAIDGAKCFATIIEIPRDNKDSYRLTVSMKIEPKNKTVSVTTMY